ncbi:OmpH family outer membrane protein [Actibacterium mucosum]|nr:OmpH family outer membrane protein [Actibacterium mucosum]
MAGPVYSQNTENAQRSALMVVDYDALLSASEYGRSIIRGIEAQNVALSNENRQIETRLEAEELALTEERETLSAEAFREKAGEFDAKVVALRRQQDEKAQNLARLRDTEQQRFYEEVFPLISQVAARHGIEVVLNKGLVLMSLEGVDRTTEVIDLIDSTLLPASDNDNR